jgi:hypothetical protein
MLFSIAAAGGYSRSFHGEIKVRAPHLVDFEFREEHEARCVDISKPVTSKAIELPEHGRMVGRVKCEQPETGQIAQGEAEGAGRVLAEPMEKPAVGLGYEG